MKVPYFRIAISESYDLSEVIALSTAKDNPLTANIRSKKISVEVQVSHVEGFDVLRIWKTVENRKHLVETITVKS